MFCASEMNFYYEVLNRDRYTRIITLTSVDSAQ